MSGPDAKKRAYAAGTEVPIERSRAECERIIRRYAATSFGYKEDPAAYTVYFETKRRQIQLTIPRPTVKEYYVETARQREERRRWRVLVITLKSTFEAIDAGVMTFDQAWLAFVVIPNSGQTIGQVIIPQLDGGRPALLAENPDPRVMPLATNERSP